MRSAIFLLLAAALSGAAQNREPIRLEKTVELPEVEGRIDHMSADIKTKRLFVAALGNNTVEVIDLEVGNESIPFPG